MVAALSEMKARDLRELVERWIPVVVPRQRPMIIPMIPIIPILNSKHDIPKNCILHLRTSREFLGPLLLLCQNRRSSGWTAASLP